MGKKDETSFSIFLLKKVFLEKTGVLSKSHALSKIHARVDFFCSSSPLITISRVNRFFFSNLYLTNTAMAPNKKTVIRPRMKNVEHRGDKDSFRFQ